MDEPAPDSDHTRRLLDRARHGDPAAVGDLLARHRPAMRELVGLHMDPRLAARLDPSDVVQDAQADLARRLPDFLERAPMPFHLWARWAHCHLGYALWDKGDPDKALASFRRFRQLVEDDVRGNPADLWARHTLAHFLAICPDGRVRDPGRALELSRRLTEEQPDEAKLWGLLGIAYYRVGRCPEAVPALERAARMKGGGTDVAYEWFYLAMAHRQLGDPYRSALYYLAAVRWMNTHKPRFLDLSRLRAEAAEVLGIKDAPKK
jgi:tetratricopeptide (TPR) repeat protein